MNGVESFRKSHNLPPTQRSSCRNCQFATQLFPWSDDSIFDEPELLKRRKIKLLLHHLARGSNPNCHTIQGAQDAPGTSDWVSNTGPGLAILGGAPLCQCCCHHGDFVTFLLNVCFLLRNRSIYGPGARYSPVNLKWSVPSGRTLNLLEHEQSDFDDVLGETT